MRPHEGAFTGLMPASCKHAGGVAEPDSAKTADRHYELLPMHARGSRHGPHPRIPAKSSRGAGPKTGGRGKAAPRARDSGSCSARRRFRQRPAPKGGLRLRSGERMLAHVTRLSPERGPCRSTQDDSRALYSGVAGERLSSADVDRDKTDLRIAPGRTDRLRDRHRWASQHPRR